MEQSNTQFYVAFCTCPDQSSAETLAAALVEARAAACVNILPGVRSIYRWQDKVEQDSEWLLLIKTSQARVAEVGTIIETQHPYDTPEMIALPVTRGLPDYLQWLVQSTA